MKHRITFMARFAAAAALACSSSATLAQAPLDICGCAGDPESKGDFVSSDGAYLASIGATVTSNTITIPLPADGKLVFDSFFVDRSPTNANVTVTFAPPESGNPPVRLLVAGNVTITVSDTVSVNGRTGGSEGLATTGGQGGPGGFRGGDSAFPEVNFATAGGAGFGPGGGAPGTGVPSLAPGEGGVFVGVPQLIPLVGGNGGGGGGAVESPPSICRGGPGGGGGGAILIAANGKVTIDGTLNANGASAGGVANGFCDSAGGGGSGGAVRIVADEIRTDSLSNSRITATGVGGGTNGAIRLEAFDSEDFGIAQSTPRAARAPAPGPLENPFLPTVDITHVDGMEVVPPLAGGSGGIDVTVLVPGAVDVELSTDGVTPGTVVDLLVKPRIGGDAQVFPVTLASCTDGVCTAVQSVDLAPGKYVLEAEATFQQP